MNEKDLTSTSVSSEVSLALVVSVLFFGFISFKAEFEQHFVHISQEKKALEESMDKLKISRAEIYLAKNPVSSWKIYENKKYGFRIKYPQNWLAPKEQGPTSPDDKYILKISFRNNAVKPKASNLLAVLAQNKEEGKKITNSLWFGLNLNYPVANASETGSNPETEPTEPQKGFDVYVYKNVAKNTPAASAPDNSNNNYLDKISSNRFFSNLSLEDFNSKIMNACSFEKNDIVKTDFYFDKSPHYSLVGEKYSFNIISLEEENTGLYELIPLDSSRSSETFEFTPFETEGPKMGIKPRPLIFKISCREENDHPRYSDTKGKHMDEDCCPDPDEWPKPGCIYSPKGYSIMLSGPPKAKLSKK